MSRNRSLVVKVAEQLDVTPDQLLAVIAARKKFRAARRRRRDDGVKNPRTKHLLSGEGELHALMRILGWSPSKTCRELGIPIGTFHNWRGHPLHEWPLHLLRLRIWSARMADALLARGVDPDQFRPVPVLKTAPAPGAAARAAAEYLKGLG